MATPQGRFVTTPEESGDAADDRSLHRHGAQQKRLVRTHKAFEKFAKYRDGVLQKGEVITVVKHICKVQGLSHAATGNSEY